MMKRSPLLQWLPKSYESEEDGLRRYSMLPEYLPLLLRHHQCLLRRTYSDRSFLNSAGFNPYSLILWYTVRIGMLRRTAA